MTSQKPIWSILPPFPDTFVAEASQYVPRYSVSIALRLFAISLCADAVIPMRRYFTAADPHARNLESFEHIVKNTLTVAIGPLEYCAIARRLHRGGSGKANPM